MKTWHTERLSAVAQLRGGGTPSKKEPQYWTGEIPWVSPKDMKSRKIDSSIDQITKQAIAESSASLLPAGSVLVVVRSGILARTVPTAIATRELTVNQDIKAICPSSRIDPWFLEYFLQSSESLLLDHVTRGATVHRLGTDTLKNLRIPIPSPREQQRIVETLDEAFAAIATATANAKKNLTNSRELFESRIDLLFQKDHGQWATGRLSKFVSEIATGPFGSLLHKSDYIDNGTPLINPINIVGNAIVPDSRKSVGLETLKRLSKYTVEEGDIVIARRGEIGRCAVVGKHESGWLCGTGCFVIKPSNEITPTFLSHLLRSSTYRKRMERVSGRATMPSLSNKDLARLEISFPPIDEQHKLLNLFDRLLGETNHLTGFFEKKTKLLTELKQSLLHQAFTGQLTANTKATDREAEL